MRVNLIRCFFRNCQHPNQSRMERGSRKEASNHSSSTSKLYPFCKKYFSLDFRISRRAQISPHGLQQLNLKTCPWSSAKGHMQSTHRIKWFSPVHLNLMACFHGLKAFVLQNRFTWCQYSLKATRQHHYLLFEKFPIKWSCPWTIKLIYYKKIVMLTIYLKNSFKNASEILL